MITVKIKFWSAQLGFCLSDLRSAFESFVSASISCYGANQFMVKKKKKRFPSVKYQRARSECFVNNHLLFSLIVN